MTARPEQPRQPRQAGFTLVEVTLVATLLTMAMAIVAMCTQTATVSLSADDRIARSMETLQRAAVRIAHIARPISLTTYRVESTAADVPTYASAAGEWMEPLNGDQRPAVRFQCASGVLSLNAAALTSPRVFRLALDDGEVDNDIDDDGDGMIDEGRVTLDYDGVTVTMAQNIEQLSFTLTDRVLTIQLSSVVALPGGGVQRFSTQETFYVRNN